MNKKHIDWPRVCITIGIILIIIGFLSPKIIKNFNKREVIVTVTDKNVNFARDTADSKYLIYTKNENEEIMVFEITDTLIYKRFNSADYYAGIETGKKYKFTITGYRIPFLSMYPNIIKYEEVK